MENAQKEEKNMNSVPPGMDNYLAVWHTDDVMIIITHKTIIHKEHARDKLSDRAATCRKARC